MKNVIQAVMVMLLGMSVAFAESPKVKAKAAGEEVLGAGKYTAQVKGIVCRGCGSFIQQTLEKISGIEKASVDQDKKAVQFQVKKNMKVKLSEVQKALRISAEKMGMDADYQLHDLKKTS